MVVSSWILLCSLWADKALPPNAESTGELSLTPVVGSLSSGIPGAQVTWFLDFPSQLLCHIEVHLVYGLGSV